MVRKGFAYDPDPSAAAPRSFSHIVTASGYKETWVEGLDVYHNPRAIHPLDPSLLPGAAHVRLLADGQVTALMPDWHPFGSQTFIIASDARL